MHPSCKFLKLCFGIVVFLQPYKGESIAISGCVFSFLDFWILTWGRSFRFFDDFPQICISKKKTWFNNPFFFHTHTKLNCCLLFIQVFFRITIVNRVSCTLDVQCEMTTIQFWWCINLVPPQMCSPIENDRTNSECLLKCAFKRSLKNWCRILKYTTIWGYGPFFWVVPFESNTAVM